MLLHPPEFWYFGKAFRSWSHGFLVEVVLHMVMVVVVGIVVVLVVLGVLVVLVVLLVVNVMVVKGRPLLGDLRWNNIYNVFLRTLYT